MDHVVKHTSGEIIIAMLSGSPIQLERKAPNSLVAQGGRWARLFILSAGVILFVTGAAKIVSALGKTEVLVMPDPIFNIPYNYFLMSIGSVELIIAISCFMSANKNNKSFALMLVVVFSMNILAYRAGLRFIHWGGYCPCLGTLFQTIHLSRYQADFLMRSVVLYLTVGSFFFLVSSWWACKIRGFAHSLNRLKLVITSSFSACGD